MNLKRRMEIIVTALTIGVIVTASLLSYWILMEDAANVEHVQLEDEVNTTVRLIDMGLHELEKTNSDYAQWDDALEYYRNLEGPFAEETFTKSVFENLNISHMLFIDPKGKVRSGFTSLRVPGEVVAMAPSDAEDFTSKYGGLISANWMNENGIKGVVLLEGQVCLLSVSRISDTERHVYDGAMAIARPLNEEAGSIIQEILGDEITFGKPDKSKKGNTESIEKPIHISLGDYTVDSRTASVAFTLMDMRWEPVLGISIAHVSKMQAMRDRIITMIVMVAFVSVLAITLLHSWLNSVFILKPIRVLSEFLDNISDNQLLHNFSAFSDRMLFKEDASVIGRVHMLLRKIGENAVQLQKERLSTRLALDSSMAGTWEYNRRNNQIQYDAQTASMLGIETCESSLPFETVLERVHPEDREDFAGLFVKCHIETGRVFQMECRLKRKAGGYCWFLIKGDGLDWDREGNGTLFSGILLDIDAKKQLESELLFLSYHDKLTGLFNRRYFEEQLLNFNLKTYLPVAIFIADINGLKLANDAFGHERGDMLLKQAAACLQAVAGETAVISRWGGDEYAVLLPRTSEAKAKEILQQIKAECRAKCAEGLGLHLAVGYSVKNIGDLSLQHVVRAAEEKMYQDKMMESRSAHTDFLDKFKQQLHEKGIETFGHCQRTAELGLALGGYLGLGDGLLEEIQQLCEIHDIGKIAMPEYIFSKADQLTELEWNLIRNHSEIGFRIVALMQDYAHLAQSVLSHHEWYDGTGYPRGLKGREIPLAARIMSISEAVTVMMAGAPYKSRMTPPEVVAELNRCKGTQFDPELVAHMISIIEAELPTAGDADV